MQDHLPDPLLLTAEEAARTMRVGRHMVFDLIRSGELQSLKIGKHRRIRRTAVEAYLQRREAAEVADTG